MVVVRALTHETRDKHINKSDAYIVFLPMAVPTNLSPLSGQTHLRPIRNRFALARRGSFDTRGSPVQSSPFEPTPLQFCWAQSGQFKSNRLIFTLANKGQQETQNWSRGQTADQQCDQLCSLVVVVVVAVLIQLATTRPVCLAQ